MDHRHASLLDLAEVVRVLGTNHRTGLSLLEAQLRLEKYGLNKLGDKDENSSALKRWLWNNLVKSFLKQFLNPLIQLLVLCAITSLALGQCHASFSIVAAVLIVSTISCLQEHHASRSLAQLSGQMQPTTCKVIREGQTYEIGAHFLVPGDIVQLAEGERVPADLRLFELSALIEAQPKPASRTHSRKARLAAGALPAANLLSGDGAGGPTPTGAPTEANESSSSARPARPAANQNLALMGTLAESGHSHGLVIATGGHTRFGDFYALLRSAQHSSEGQLEANIDQVSIQLVILHCLLISAISILGIAQQRAPLEVVYYAIALLVVAIPEGLPGVLAASKFQDLQRAIVALTNDNGAMRSNIQSLKETTASFSTLVGMGSSSPASSSPPVRGVGGGGGDANVQKKAGETISMDEDFSALQRLVSEGRGIYHKIHTFLAYQISLSLALVLLLAIAFACSAEPPLSIFQLLYLNVLVDGPLAQALSMEELSEHELGEWPRAPTDPIVSCRLMGTLAVLTSSLLMVNGGLYAWLLDQQGRLDDALQSSTQQQVATTGGRGVEDALGGASRSRTLLFTCFVFSTIFAAISLKSKFKTMLETRIYSTNRHLFLCCLAVAGVQIFITQTPRVNQHFQLEALKPLELFCVISYAFLVLMLMDSFKVLVRFCEHARKLLMKICHRIHSAATTTTRSSLNLCPPPSYLEHQQRQHHLNLNPHEQRAAQPRPKRQTQRRPATQLNEPSEQLQFYARRTSAAQPQVVAPSLATIFESGTTSATMSLDQAREGSPNVPRDQEKPGEKQEKVNQTGGFN